MTQKISEYNIDTSVFNKYSINVVRIANVEVTDSNYTPIAAYANIAAVDNTGGYIIINGSGFAANAQVYYNVNSSLTITNTTSTQIKAIVPATPTGNYDLFVQNPSGSTALRKGLLKISGPVSWTTSSTLTTTTTNTNTELYIVATSDSDIISYEILSGSLPPNHSFNTSSGLLSGNVTYDMPYTTYSFTVRATDSEYQYNERLFNIGVANTVVFSISPAVSGKTTWTVSVDGPLNLSTATTYTVVPNANTAVNVKMWGAGGGAGQLATGSQGAAGGFTRGVLKLYKSNTYNFIVGGGGGGGGSTRVSGGGGAGTGIQIATGTVPLMVAGGGGGSWGTSVPPGANEARGGGGGGNSGQTPAGGSGGGGGSQVGAGAGGTLTPGAGSAGSGRNGGDGASTTSSWPAAGGTGFGNGGRGGYDAAAAGGGGGGGGYFGGGGGGYTSAAYGGGGGSGYIHPTEVIGGITITSSFNTVANSADTIRGTAGNGGASIGLGGTAGRIYVTHEYTL